MRAKYSIAIALLAATAWAGAETCPQEVSAVARRVAALRAVPEPFAPPCRLIRAEVLGQELDRKLREELPIRPELYLEAMRRTGFIDGDPATVYAKLLEFYESQVLGFFEPAANELVVVDSPSAGETMASMVWAHELEHAAQQRRSRLPGRLLAMRSDSDRQRAASAIAEGDAMLVMLTISRPERSPDELGKLVEETLADQAETLAAPAQVPEFFVRDLVFPYTTGLSTVLAAFRRGGWPAVDALLVSPPATTAELIDPKYRPSTPRLADTDLPPTPAGYEEVMTDDLGRWGLAFWLSRRLPRQIADGLAARWDGDRLRLVRDRRNPNAWALAWRLRCRDEAQRRDLEKVLREELPPLLHNLSDSGPGTIIWLARGRELEFRASWPLPAPARPRSPS